MGKDLADGEGFEPPVQFPTQQFSRLTFDTGKQGVSEVSCHTLDIDSEARLHPDLIELTEVWSSLSPATREAIAMLIRAESGRLVEKPSTN